MRLDERGKQCPLPVIEAKKALDQAAPGTVVEIVVDNEIAVQNLQKLADHKGLESAWEKAADREFLVRITAGGSGAEQPGEFVPDCEECSTESIQESQAAQHQKGTVVVLSSDQMGQGDEVLGKLLMKGFVYAVTQQDELPETVLLYNGGARLSCAGSDSLEDLQFLAEQGVEILTCGTCLNHYGLSDTLSVGEVTNMYEITERMTKAGKLIRP